MDLLLGENKHLCEKKSLEHSFVSKWYGKTGKWLDIFIYVLGFATTSSLFTEYFSSKEEGGNTTIVATITSALNLGLAGLSDKISLTTRSEIHNTICIAWGELERDIAIFMVSDKSSDEKQIYLSKLNQKIKELMVSETPCPAWATRKVETIFSKRTDVKRQDSIRNRVRIKTLDKRRASYDEDLYKKTLPSMGDARLKKIAKAAPPVLSHESVDQMSRNQLLDYLMLDVAVNKEIVESQDAKKKKLEQFFRKRADEQIHRRTRGLDFEALIQSAPMVLPQGQLVRDEEKIYTQEDSDSEDSESSELSVSIKEESVTVVVHHPTDIVKL